MAEIQQADIVGNYLSSYYGAQQKQQQSQDAQFQRQRQVKADDRVDQEWHMKLDDRQAADAEKKHEIIARVAFSADTPEKWQAAVPAAAQQIGWTGPLPGFDQRQRILSEAQTVGDQLNAARQKRLDDSSLETAKVQRDSYRASAEKDRASAANPGGGISPEYAQALVNYDADLPSPRSANYQSAIVAAKALDPNFNAAEFSVRKGAKKAFATGKQGDTVRSLGVGMDHLATLSELAAALKNRNVPMFNQIAQTWAQQTGSPVPTSFDAAKTIVGNEVAKAIIGGQNAQADREEAQAAFSRANSPDQLLGAINTVKALMGGQVRGLKMQYERTTKAKDFNDQFLTEGARTLLGGPESTVKDNSAATVD